MRTGFLIILGMLMSYRALAADFPEMKSPAGIAAAFSPRARARMLNVWATWCIPCVQEFGDLKSVDGHFDERVEIIGVSLDDAIPDSRAVRKQIAQNFLDKQKVDFRNFYYTGKTSALQKFFGFGEIPVTILYDARGREVWRHEGRIRRAELIRQVNVVLDKREKK